MGNPSDPGPIHPLARCKLLALLALEKETKTPGPRAEQRFPRARRAAHPRRGYSCYIYRRQTRGADRAGADVEYRVVGGVSCVENGGTNGGGGWRRTLS